MESSGNGCVRPSEAQITYLARLQMRLHRSPKAASKTPGCCGFSTSGTMSWPLTARHRARTITLGLLTCSKMRENSSCVVNRAEAALAGIGVGDEP